LLDSLLQEIQIGNLDDTRTSFVLFLETSMTSSLRQPRNN